MWRPELDPGTGGDSGATRGGPVYRAIADALERDIRSGVLPAGARLPTQRQLAGALGVDLTTVSRAYREGRTRGLISGVTGKGTFVCKEAGQPEADPASIDMTMNHPPVTPELEHHLRAAVASLGDLVATGVPSGYGPPAGSAGDRAIGARWVAQRLPGCDPERLVICQGVQGALQLFCLSAVGPGNTLLTERVTYPGIKSIAAHLGIRLVGVAMDGEGMCPDALEQALRETGAGFVYCTPTLHNPTTATMSPPRREAIARVLRSSGALMLEDDVYGLLEATAPPPLASLVPDQVFYATSLSKVVAPALRAGYLVAPGTRSFAGLEAASRAVIYSVSPFNTLMTRALTVGGHLHDIVHSIREEARARQRLAAELLPTAYYSAHPDAHHGWLQLPPGWSGAAFSAHARQNDVLLAAGETFAIPPAVDEPVAVRLSLGSARDRDRLAHALGALSDLLALDPGKAIVSG